MARITKASKLAQYDALVKRNDLLSYFLWDKTLKRIHDSCKVNGEWRLVGYRLTSAHGGYVVLIPKGGTPDIAYLDDLIARYSADDHPSTVDLRMAIERMRITRNELFQKRHMAVRYA